MEKGGGAARATSLDITAQIRSFKPTFSIAARQKIPLEPRGPAWRRQSHGRAAAAARGASAGNAERVPRARLGAGRERARSAALPLLHPVPAVPGHRGAGAGARAPPLSSPRWGNPELGVADFNFYSLPGTALLGTPRGLWLLEHLRGLRWQRLKLGLLIFLLMRSLSAGAELSACLGRISSLSLAQESERGAEGLFWGHT